MSEEIEEIKEKNRLNQISFLKFLGYSKPTEDLTIDEVNARIELLREQRENETKEPKSKLTGIDGFKENIKALTGKDPKEYEEEQEYDPLSAYISQLTPDDRLNSFEGARILRILRPIDIGNGQFILRRVVL